MKFVKWAPFVLAVLAGSASAEGLYITGEVSHAKDSLNRNYFDNSLTAAGAAGLSSSSTGSSNQWRLQGGYRFNPNFAAEVGYIDFGSTRYSATYGGGTALGSLEAGGVDAAELVLLPLDNNFTVFGKAGIVVARVKATYPAETVANLAVTDTATTVVRPLLGVGALYKLTQNLDLRAEFDHVSKLGASTKTGTMNANMFSLGVAYNF